MHEIDFSQAYLGYLFCSGICECGKHINDLLDAANHFHSGHYDEYLKILGYKRKVY
jgi:hypothetical protein